LIKYNFIISLFILQVLTSAQTLHKLEIKIPEQESVTDTISDSTVLSGDTVSWSSLWFHYDAGKESFSLYDKAVLKYQNAVLRADTIYLYNKTQIVYAYGTPTIEEKSQPPIMGYRLKYNHNRQIGEIYWGTTSRDRQTFNGIEVRRQKSGDIHISRGDFSTCDNLEDQHYYFYSRRMVLEPKKKVLARPVIMNIAGVPVGVLPLLVMPIGKGRRSGFIRPKWGGDQAQGFYIRDVGYYFSGNEYMDFLLSSDLIEGERGTFDKTNINSVYNYKVGKKLNGILNGKAYVSEFNLGNSGWEINFQHNHNLTPDNRQTIRGNGKFVSSRRVLSEALTEDEAINQTANATLGYSNNMDWNKARLNVNATQDFNLTTGKQTRDLPNVSFAFSAPLFPLEESDYWDTGEGEPAEPEWYRKWNYRYNGDLKVYRQEDPQDSLNLPINDNTFVGAKNHLDFNAKYSAFQYINVVPNINLDHFWSLQSITSKNQSYKMDYNPGNSQVGSNLYKYSMGVNTNTKLYGIGKLKIGRVEKIRHVITPSVGYTWRPEIDSVKHFVLHPRLGTSLGQKESQLIRFGLGNDVDLKLNLGKKDSLSTKSKGESYNVFKTNSNVSYDFEQFNERPWSNINSNFSTYIFKKYVPINIGLVHSLYDDFGPLETRNREVVPILMSYSFNWRRSLALGGKMNSGLKTLVSMNKNEFDMQPWSANLNYGFNYSATRISRARVFRKTVTHNFSSNFSLKPTPNWDLKYSTSYDFKLGKINQHRFDISRTLHCWKMDFRWSPVGLAGTSGWSFNIYIIDLPDIKFESSDRKLPKR